jgi:hypothetical protein
MLALGSVTRMTTWQVVSAGWQPASRVRQDAGLPVACCAPLPLDLRRRAEDCPPYLSAETHASPAPLQLHTVRLVE